jgi:hypothetical protein
MDNNVWYECKNCLYGTNQVNEWMDHISTERHMNANFYDNIKEYLENSNQGELFEVKSKPDNTQNRKQKRNLRM